MTTTEIIAVISIISSFVSIAGAWGVFSRAMGKYQEKIDTLVRDVRDLVLSVKQIEITLQNFGQRIASLETACGINEHISLTEEGKAVLAESGGKDFDDDNKK